MPEIKVYDIEKNPVDTVELNPSVFGVPLREHLLYYVVNWQLAKRRAGTASTKTRREVSGSGKKPWRQKHTGRARQGSIRAPHWKGGGVAFGPKPKDWSFDLPKKVRREALRCALSLKARDENLVILKDFDLPVIKTKQIMGFLKTFGLEKTLVVINGDNENLIKSARNLKEVKVLKTQGLNIYDILRFKTLTMTHSALRKVEEVLGQ